MEMNLISKSIKSYLPAGECKDELDYSVIKFGNEISLRTNVGLYLSALTTKMPLNNTNISTNIGNTNSSIPSNLNSTIVTNKNYNIIYSASAKGQGIGESNDCLSFINIEKRDDNSPIRYGMTISLKSIYAKEKLLGIKESKPGFYRNLIGQGEKWIILKGFISSLNQFSLANEDIDSRGKYVRIGDLILLQSNTTSQLLTLYEGISGSEIQLKHRESNSLLGDEMWQIELFNSQPLPIWLNRPYLSRRFLLNPANTRLSTTDIENRSFPGLLSNNNIKSSTEVIPLNTFSIENQQMVLLREIINMLIGIEGQYIRVATNSNISIDSTTSSNSISKKLLDLSLTIDIDTADKATANQVIQLLPLCECIIHIREFIRLHNNYDYGLVSHAVCSAIKEIVREFDILIGQLEYLLIHNQLTLQKLIYLLQPTKGTIIGVIHPLTCKLLNTSGGCMLNVVHIYLQEQGDRKAREITNEILIKAYEPFLVMLGRWLFRGELSDIYKEFMIYEDKSINRETLQQDFNANYWDHKYTLNEYHIPNLLKPYASKILIAGKYLNVVRGCFNEVNKYTNNQNKSNYSFSLPQMKQFQLNLELGNGLDSLNSLTNHINSAYDFSSQALLQLLIERYDIINHLRSLRRFFLLENGDFFIQFMDTSEQDLRQDVKDIILTKIHNQLQLAIQTSTIGLDHHKDDLSCNFASHNLIQHLHLIQSAGSNITSESYSIPTQGLKGIEALTLDYHVSWPISILLSRRAITKYQLLSRLLYFSKHVERRLLSCWSNHQTTKSLNIRSLLGPSYCLRHRMLHFIQNFVYYMTFEVINPRSHEMNENINIISDIDQLLILHEKFLDTCLKECLLASQDLLKILMKLMTTCLLFADNTKKFTIENDNENDNFINKITTQNKKSILNKRKLQEEFIKRETTHESYQKMLEKFINTFDTQLKEFLEKLWTDSFRHHPQLSNLCVRLDYNGFYSSIFTSESSININNTYDYDSYSIHSNSSNGSYNYR